MYVVVENTSYSLAVFGPYASADEAEAMKSKMWSDHIQSGFAEQVAYHVRQVREVEYV